MIEGGDSVLPPFFFLNSMDLLFTSFIAGMLTVLAPCVFPLLPVIVGGSLLNHDKYRPFIVTGALALSVVVFTLLLKATTAFIFIPSDTWKILSGGLVFVFGVFTVFPKIWERIEVACHFGTQSQILLQDSHKKQGRLGAFLVGMSLGPVFSSCSPTYVLILATVLPQSFATGLLYLVAYALGLAVVLLGIAFFGQTLVAKLKWAANPNGIFKKLLGILLMIIGIVVVFGLDKRFKTYLIEHDYFDAGAFETRLLR